MEDGSAREAFEPRGSEGVRRSTRWRKENRERRQR